MTKRKKPMSREALRKLFVELSEAIVASKVLLEQSKEAGFVVVSHTTLNRLHNAADYWSQNGARFLRLSRAAKKKTAKRTA